MGGEEHQGHLMPIVETWSFKLDCVVVVGENVLQLLIVAENVLVQTSFFVYDLDS
jgi:hypothetical protein